MLLMILAPVFQNKINKLVDMVALINARNSDKHHIFYNIQVHASGMVFKVQAMINTETIYNLIAQILVKKHNIPRDDKISSLMAANEGKLRFYKQHRVTIKTYGYNGL